MGSQKAGLRGKQEGIADVQQSPPDVSKADQPRSFADQPSQVADVRLGYSRENLGDGRSLLTLGQASLEEFFDASESYKRLAAGPQYIIDIVASDRQRKLLRASLPGSEVWFDIPAATIDSIAPLASLDDSVTKVLVALFFNDNAAALDQTFRSLGGTSVRPVSTVTESVDDRVAVSNAQETAASDRRSERWLSYYELALPAGEFEVQHLDNRNFYPTQIIADSRDRDHDLYIGRGATRWFFLDKSQRVRFQLENDPILKTVWEVQNNPRPVPSPDGGTEMRYSYGSGAPRVVFRYGYGGTGAGLMAGGTKIVARSGSVASPRLADPWARGMSDFAHSSDPESWVRGAASVDRSSGIISHTLQLETDSVSHGPRGQMTVTVYDAADRKLAETKVEAGMGGKPPGRAVIRNFTGQKQIPLNIAEAAQRVAVDVQHTGRQLGLFGIDFGDILNAIKLIFVIGGGGDSDRLAEVKV